MNERDSSTRLHEELLALPASELAPPHVDARVAALIALGVVDFATGEQGRARLAKVNAPDAFDAALLEDLAQLAQALLKVVDVYDTAPRDPRPVSVSAELDVECRTRRSGLIALLINGARDAPGVPAALRRAKLSYGPIDLASDLRSLASLVELNELDMALPQEARAVARQVEEILTSSDTPQLRAARVALHRVWTLFAAKYQKVASVGRQLFGDDTESLFPTLDAIASIERTARHGSTSSLPASVLVERAMPESVRPAVSSRRMRAVRAPYVEAKPVAAEVHLEMNSDSNLWLGFSQDIAEGGLFVATHTTPAIGVPMELTVTLPQGEPLQLTGIVHWSRPEVGNDDAPPGVGVRFTNLSADDAKALSGFAARRTPMFYDD